MKERSKTIAVTSSEDVQEVVKKIANAKESFVIISVPRNSILSGSLNNLQFLKKKSLESGKKIAIESVDDHTLDLALIAGIESTNPIFRVRPRPVFDVVPRFREKQRESAKPKIPYQDEIDEIDDEEAPETINISTASRSKESRKKVNPKKTLKVFIFLFFVSGLSLVAFFTATQILPKAEISLFLKEYPVNFDETVTASVSLPAPNYENGKILIPAELLVSSKNMQADFPASGREKVIAYAEGRITIFNSFSSVPQVLVEKTRFQAPDSRIFRLKENIVIPGANVQDGKIQPSSIEAVVVADKPGQSENIGPVQKWTIPGFQDSPKFQTFYGISVSPMKGGFSGERALPSSDDITKAKEEIKERLLKILEEEIGAGVSPDLEILEGTTGFSIKKEDVYPSNDPSKFSVFMEGELRQLVFKTETLEMSLIKEAKKSLKKEIEFELKSLSLKNEVISADLEKGEISFKVAGTATFRTRIDTNIIKARIAKKESGEVKKILFDLPGLERARISLWPFWVARIPADPAKITVSVR